MGKRRFLAVLGRSAVVSALGLSALVALPATHAAGAASCTDVQFIGLRGSGENPPDSATHDMGALVGPMVDAAAALAPSGTTISYYGLPYPAADAVTGVFNGNYFESEAVGVAELEIYLAATTASCPAMKLVVMGYSQGAQAVGDLLQGESAAVLGHIASVVLFGDPEFNPAAPYDEGSFDTRDYGLAGKRTPTSLAALGNKIGSWCRRNDLICQGIGKGHSIGQHLPPGYLADYTATIAGFVRSRLGWPLVKPTAPLDLAFVIDSTGSMADSIDGAESAAESMTTALQAAGTDFHVGLVDYKDTDQGDPYAAQVDVPFTTSLTDLAAGLNSLVASGGGDLPEAVYSGIMTAINDLSWRHGARKIIIVMGDAPGKDPEPVTGYTLASVLAAANALDPAVAYPVPIGPDPIDFFGALATGSGGQSFPADDPSAVSDQVLTAVTSAAVPLTAALSVTDPNRTGDPVGFSAAGSWYDGGTITSYGWDFDGDGTIDATTTTPTTTHTFAAAVSTTASVTVTTNDGHSATASAVLDVSDTAPIPPSAPTSVTLTPGADQSSLSASWAAPADIGGGTLVGYDVLLSVGGVVVGVDANDPASTTANFTGLAAGSYAVAVSAITDGGGGPPATATAGVTGAPGGGGAGGVVSTAAVSRIAGQDRIATSIAASLAEFPGAGGAKAVVLAAAGGFADALAGTPLAVAKGGPLLLTGSATLDVRTKAEITRVLPPGGTVYVLGGSASIAPAISGALSASGFTVVRYGGVDRFDTARIIATSGLGDPGTILLASGLNFPDGLAAGPGAASVNGAVLLTDGAALDGSTAAYLAAHPSDKVYSVGGSAAHADAAATPLVGADRYATAALVANVFFPHASVVGLSTGQAFPDALSGGAMVARQGGPMLLTPTSTLSTAVAGYLGTNPAVTKVLVFGGTAAVSNNSLAGL